MAFLVGVTATHSSEYTPTRCVQRLSAAMQFASLAETATLSRGRIALPPRHDEGRAFVVGGGKVGAHGRASSQGGRHVG